jgi:hypothetical protein
MASAIFELLDWGYHIFLPALMRFSASLCGLLVIATALFVAAAAQLAYGWHDAWGYVLFSLPFMFFGAWAFLSGLCG